MFQLLLAVIYLAFISLGLPDSLLGAAWPTMYPEFDVPVSYAGIILHDHRSRHDRLKPAERPPDQKTRCRKSDRAQRCNDRLRTVWLLHQSFLLCHDLLGNSIWSRRGKRGCRLKQLCRASF